MTQAITPIQRIEYTPPTNILFLYENDRGCCQGVLIHQMTKAYEKVFMVSATGPLNYNGYRFLLRKAGELLAGAYPARKIPYEMHAGEMLDRPLLSVFMRDRHWHEDLKKCRLELDPKGNERMHGCAVQLSVYEPESFDANYGKILAGTPGARYNR